MIPTEGEVCHSRASDRAVWPWQAEPYRLWSLFEMLRFSANSFFWCGRALRTIRGDCLAGSAACFDGAPGFAVYQDLDQAARAKALSSLASVEDQCRNIGMAITADMVKDLLVELESQSRRSFDWLISQADTIERLAEKELKNKLFFYIPPERVQFFPSEHQPHMFGAVVADEFPDANQDIAAAGRCLGLSEGTACVFHLMRVLEHGLRGLATNVGLPPEMMALENWKNVIDQIEKKIRDMESLPKSPEKSEALQRHSAAATQFRYFKDAWRNHVSHARAVYTPSDAEVIWRHAQEFMQHIAASV